MCRHIGIETGLDGTALGFQNIRWNTDSQHMIIVLCLVHSHHDSIYVAIISHLFYAKIEFSTLILTEGNPLFQRHFNDGLLKTV